MDEKQIKTLKDKVEDYRRFAYILLSLGIFLFIGILIPNDSGTAIEPSHFIIAVFIMLGASIFFHRKATYYQKLVNNDGEIE
ncbi:YrhC family protein [Alkalihalobacillus sp. LMS39]|uniref:YrhC family protein n=1 Tax=Alkalihalobacillus sp. LMS39 TaxID=2924032 RepID=UPI001FB228D4|nr:YrhC family protein [Alkalihalobacillus sp. LMS39]UOE95588.1 YrhC family protein [Alkalihalobacillus sp. LMS39]